MGDFRGFGGLGVQFRRFRVQSRGLGEGVERNLVRAVVNL